jgi:hypothetical protein
VEERCCKEEERERVMEKGAGKRERREERE